MEENLPEFKEIINKELGKIRWHIAQWVYNFSELDVSSVDLEFISIIESFNLWTWKR